jgi:D-glycerate 3-kinase
MDALPLLLDWLAALLRGKPLIIGLAGAQGSGKSTLAAQLAKRLRVCAGALPNGAGALPDAGGSVPPVSVAVSLDDFYLTRARRQALAAQIHPLFATRGVPGTHDLPLLLDVLLRVRSGRPVSLPVFDKLADDRLPPQHWRRFARIDVLILEGWCIGARPQPAALLAEPINALEDAEDPHAIWRNHVNQALAAMPAPGRCSTPSPSSPRQTGKPSPAGAPNRKPASPAPPAAGACPQPPSPASAPATNASPAGNWRTRHSTPGSPCDLMSIGG